MSHLCLFTSHFLLNPLQSCYWYQHTMLIAFARFNKDNQITSSKQIISIFGLDLLMIFDTVVFSILLEIVPFCSFYDPTHPYFPFTSPFTPQSLPALIPSLHILQMLDVRLCYQPLLFSVHIFSFQWLHCPPICSLFSRLYFWASSLFSPLDMTVHSLLLNVIIQVSHRQLNLPYPDLDLSSLPHRMSLFYCGLPQSIASPLTSLLKKYASHL